MSLKSKINLIPWILLAIIILAAGSFFGYKFYQTKKLAETQTKQVATAPQQKNPYSTFAGEVYSIIQTNYWNKISDADLSNLYLLATQKVASSTTLSLTSKDKAGIENLIADQTKNLAPDKQKEFVANVCDVVLANLQPFGRSRLYTQQLETALSNEVNNIDTSNNMYSVLGVKNNATPETISKTYQTEAQKLANDKSSAAKEKLALVNRAYEALKTPTTRQIYDQTGEEPSVTYKLLTPDIFYIKISRFSPTLIAQFQAAAKTVDNQPQSLHTLVLDLRGNIGGAIDQLPDFLGPFIGQGQFAFQYFHQGEYTPYKTTTGYINELVRYKRVVILVDNQTQSSAEVMAGTLKKYNVGVLVGQPTKGWGSIERVFPIQTALDSKQTYSAFLVHTLTLGDDNQPIEGKGILPAVNIADKNWEKQLAEYYNDPSLISSVKQLFGSN